MQPAITIEDLKFGWEPGRALLDIDHLAIDRGQRVFLHGASGSGKSTLLGLIGGVLTPETGRLAVLDQDLAALRRGDRDRFRAEHIGFVFQQFNLLSYLSVLDNVTLACRFSAARARRAVEVAGSIVKAADHLLRHLGIEPSLHPRAATALSVGQQQRVAVARALIGRPELLIADEPTSALDHDARGDFLKLLLSECDASGTTVLFVSHDPSLARWFDVRLDMRTMNGATADG